MASIHSQNISKVYLFLRPALLQVHMSLATLTTTPLDKRDFPDFSSKKKMSRVFLWDKCLYVTRLHFYK